MHGAAIYGDRYGYGKEAEHMNIPPNFLKGHGLLKAGIPWLAPACTRWLEQILTEETEVLEFGGGGSTVFFSERCGHVTTCESSPAWAKQIQAELDRRGAANVRLITCVEPPAAIADRKYDLCLVDSTHLLRERATFYSLRLVRFGGYILLDNYYMQYAEKSRFMLSPFDFIDYNYPGYSGQGTRACKVFD